MELILLERVEKLGLIGEVVQVKPGYARNFLLPQKKAILATAENKERFEKERVQVEANNLETKKEAETIGGKLAGILVVIVRQAGDSGQLYGSVNTRDVASRLKKEGYNINRSQVSLERPIKTVGLHPINIALHPEVSVIITANVARSEEEGMIQERTGEALIAVDSDEGSEVDVKLSDTNDQSESETEDAIAGGEQQGNGDTESASDD